MSEPFGFGPAWARDTTCCGKPHGCTNMSEQCRMRHHPWKRWHARYAAHCETCTNCAPGLPCDAYREILAAGPATPR